ncbi:hypothetical protein [Pedobacter sp. JY14-1]|uniref:hypothetical protein n=1 Tax=Pedobacter sp. JY14-1 TaxID=3034151 RepID=UPI0023E146B4|nr:hypothetical protein [Pedobacter sp. JY14-1]
MANQHAFGKRDFFSIFLRRLVYLIFRVIKKLFTTQSEYGPIVFYKATSQQEYSDLIKKISWFLPDEKVLANAVLVSSDNFEYIEKSNYLSDKYRASGFSVRLEHSVNDNMLFSSASIIVLTKFRYIFKLAILKNIGKIEITDPYFFSYVESIAWQNLCHNSMNKESKSYYKEVTKRNFSVLQQRIMGRENAVCFVTGPSFDAYKDYNFETYDLKLICNSIVKNDDFLTYIGGPDILVFADPVFHFGPSLYAESFRDCVFKVVRKYKCFVFVPISTLPLILNRAEDLSQYFIGIEYRNTSFHFPTSEEIYVKDNGNILTNLLIPIASSFANKISIFGADGRSKGEKYFWTHSKTAQFNDLMNSTFESHPSFFRDRDYSDYYEQHCKTVNDLLEFGEAQGKVYYALTRSFIPALHSREVNTRSHNN